MNKAKEVKTLTNKAWFISKRGGVEEQKRKEGLRVTQGCGEGAETAETNRGRKAQLKAGTKGR